MLVAVALFALSAPARADVEFTLGNNPQNDEENVLFTDDQTGSPVFGVTNQSNITVRFSSTTDSLSVNSAGQARVEAEDEENGELLNNITIDIPNGSFGDIILNPFDGSGTAVVTVVTDDNFVFEYELDNGQNFLTIVATNGQRIQSVTIDAEDGFHDLRQPRISGAAVVPEPSTMALAFVGVAGLGLKGLRRLRRRSATAPA